jgi:hypothetical protein
LKVKDAPFTNASLHVSFLPNVVISLTLFDNDVEIASARGKGCATIRSVFMHLVEETKAVDKKAAQTAPIPPPKHKYVLQAKIETSVEKFVASQETRPNSRGPKPTSAKSKLKNGTPGKLGTTPQEDSKWKLRLVSTEPGAFQVAKDTEKEDHFRSIKESWETNSPGRLQSAREVREAYSKVMESGQISPIIISLDNINIKPWTVVKENAPRIILNSEKVKRVMESNLEIKAAGSMADVKGETKVDVKPEVKDVKVEVKPEVKEVKPELKPDLKDAKPSEKDDGILIYKSVLVDRLKAQIMEPDHVQKSIQDQLTAIENAQNWIQDIRQLRLAEKETRAIEKRLQVECVENKQKEMESWWKIDINHRELYRQRVIKEEDELELKLKAARDAATRVLEQESLAAGEDAALRKKGKK